MNIPVCMYIFKNVVQRHNILANKKYWRPFNRYHCTLPWHSLTALHSITALYHCTLPQYLLLHWSCALYYYIYIIIK